MMKPGSLPAGLAADLKKLPLPKTRLRLILGAAILLVILAAGGLWAANRSRIQRPAAEIVPAEQVARSVPFMASHTSREALPAGMMESSPADGARPAADLGLTYYDFGRIGSSLPVSRTFTLWNRGDAPLIIEKAYTTCACTRAEISSVEIPPGMASQITIQFDPGVHNVQGMTVRRGLLLALNDPANPSLEIWVQASVEK